MLKQAVTALEGWDKAVALADLASFLAASSRDEEAAAALGDAVSLAEGEALANEEERARRRASLTMRDNGDGTVEGRFKLPVLHAALLRKALEALTSPRRLGEGRVDPATGKKLPYEVLLGQGFMELVENHLNPAQLPSQANSPFTLPDAQVEIEGDGVWLEVRSRASGAASRSASSRWFSRIATNSISGVTSPRRA